MTMSLTFDEYKTLVAERERYKAALEVIREAGNNESAEVQRIQQFAAHILTNGRVPRPEGL